MSSTTTQTLVSRNEPAKTHKGKPSTMKNTVALEQHPIPFSINDCLIPEHAGSSPISNRLQWRTLKLYAAIYVAGFAVFNSFESPAVRVFGLGLVFPGAGFTAIYAWQSLLAFTFSLAMIPASALVWLNWTCWVFGPIVHVLLACGAAFMVGHRSPVPAAGYAWAFICPSLVAFLAVRKRTAKAAGVVHRLERNKYIPTAVAENIANAPLPPPPGSRELDLKTLRILQTLIECGLSDDFSLFDKVTWSIDGGLRYQFYALVNALALFQTHYAPNFHGYVSEACRNSLEKSFTKEAVGYWKLEAMVGNLEFRDFNPIKKDNIMVTGYLAAAMAAYLSSSGDRRYLEEDCIEFVVDDNHRYKTNFQGILNALEDNFIQAPYCLYPCEPRWTFSMCNLVAMSGIVMGDRILNTTLTEKYKARFERIMEEDFTTSGGRLITLRNEQTGIRLPAMGMFAEQLNGMLLTCCLPHLGHRSWAVTRKELVTIDERGKVGFKELSFIDNVDPGYFRSSHGFTFSCLAMLAAEYGDEQLKKRVIEQLDTEAFPIEPTPSGSLISKGMSVLSQAVLLMARLTQHLDLANAAVRGPDPLAMTGPLLAKAPFPEVLVAKAYSIDGKKLEMVLYPGKQAGRFELSFERLQPGRKYSVQGTGTTISAGKEGRATVEVAVNGRTEVVIMPM